MNATLSRQRREIQQRRSPRTSALTALGLFIGALGPAGCSGEDGSQVGTETGPSATGETSSGTPEASTSPASSGTGAGGVSAVGGNAGTASTATNSSGAGAGGSPSAVTSSGGGGAGGSSGDGAGGSASAGGAPVMAGAGTGGLSGEPLEPQVNVAKLDLLLVVDNSVSMDEPQRVLLDSLPALTEQLSTLADVHIAVISSSLGNHGFGASETICPTEMHQNDAAHLLAVSRGDAALAAESYDGLGFLSWDPIGVQVPPGDSSLEVFTAKLSRQVAAVEAIGCGFEAPLEAAYRFLVEPNPYQSVERVACTAESITMACAAPVGTDDALLAQRAAFLRDDSTLAVVFLTNENDCSIRDSGQGYYVMRPDVAMARGTSACDVDPNDECCQSCAAGIRAGCEADPNLNGCVAPEAVLEATETQQVEAFAVRCFDQKRRFGIDFLYSTTRYAAGFTELEVQDRDGELVANPLFFAGRSPSQVFVAAIAGTPWQDVVESVAEPSGEVMNGTDLEWPWFLPPASGTPPLDPFNIEAVDIRLGMNPVSLEALGGPGSFNTINGHDRSIVSGDGFGDDLQFACLFRLAEPKDCSSPEADPLFCDCTRNPDIIDPSVIMDYATDNPQCRNDAGDYGTTQYFGKAYPAPRLFELILAMNGQGVLGSLCARNTTDPERADFGYAPIFRALLRAMSQPPI